MPFVVFFLNVTLNSDKKLPTLHPLRTGTETIRDVLKFPQRLRSSGSPAAHHLFQLSKNF